ncbi:MAG: betaine/proline/choline family ABC transporter ATP-binding protein [Lautropia sp.]|nr:betaine/proline/choline family ABC transporter ATP-binding protein [Lautropia sp.]
MSVIAFRNVSKIYGSHTKAALQMLNDGLPSDEIFNRTGCRVGLRKITLDISEGGVFSIIGLSGSGKSTLVRHINRLIEPSCGQVWACETNVTALTEAELRRFRRERVSMVFQHFGLQPHMTVLQNTCYGLRVQGVTEREQQERGMHWLQEMGLADQAGSHPDQLSGGMRQRVGLARALTADTDIILMDEAFSALDPLIRIKLQDVVLNLQQRLGKTIVFITHDIDEALKMGNRIAILNAGELVQTGTPEDLLHDPANDYVAEFMQAARLR